MAETVNNRQSYEDYMAETVNNRQSYEDYMPETVNNRQSYEDYEHHTEKTVIVTNQISIKEYAVAATF